MLHAQPVNFALDHRSGLIDPRGQLGQSLAVDMHMLTVDSDAIQNLVRCMKRCDLELAGIASSAYVSGISALVEDEQELGAACIDMGGGSTSVSIFLKKHMIYADSVPMGGDHVTGDISMGLGIPMATGAAVACPDRRVVALQADGSALYTLQGLWTQAREGLNVTTVILSNNSYAILQGEMAAVGATMGAAADELFNLDRPVPDWLSIAKGFGIPATRAETIETLIAQINRANATPGPSLIELLI